MIARFHGTCPLCQRGIQPGFDPITREPEKGGRWVHSFCLDSVTVDPAELDAELTELLGGT